MSDCNKAHELYSVCFEKEASAFEERFFDTHLAACPECRRDYTDFKATQSLLAGMPRVEVSADFEERVLAQVRAAVREARPAPALPDYEREPRWWEGWMPRFALAGAAAALLAVVSIPGLRPGGTPDSAPRYLAGAGSPASATVEPVVERLGDRFPDLPPEVLKSLDEESYVLDRMTIRAGSADGGARFVAPVDYESSGPVYVTF